MSTSNLRDLGVTLSVRRTLFPTGNRRAPENPEIHNLHAIHEVTGISGCQGTAISGGSPR